MESYKVGLNKIKAFIFDVDGVFTDGSVYLFENEKVRVLNSRDRLAVKYASDAGLKVFVISGGNSSPIKEDLESFGAAKVFLGVQDKLSVYKTILNDYSLDDESILYMGDDLPDLPVLEKVGVSTCPSNACADVQVMVDYVSKFPGGKFAVRDVIEQTLRVQGKWNQ